MIKALGYATKHSFTGLKPLAFEREEAGPSEVEIEVLYCGVCHSDIHRAENDWGNTVYPGSRAREPSDRDAFRSQSGVGPDECGLSTCFWRDAGFDGDGLQTPFI